MLSDYLFDGIILLGHQLYWPNNLTIAGTIRVLVMNVSMITPIATANPSWNKSVNGSTIKAENVPAKIIPAEVMTPPVLATAICVASVIFLFLLLL